MPASNQLWDDILEEMEVGLGPGVGFASRIGIQGGVRLAGGR